MNKIKDRFLGARFTEKEKKEIINLIKKKGISVSKFIREAIFSHLNFLKEHNGQLEKLKVYVIKEVD